jgi:multicomponent Na+:H+ antiporter subunit E
MWMILTANLHVSNIVIGMGISFLIAQLTTRLFEDTFEPINPYYLGVYLLVLLKNLIISNLQITKRTLSRDMHLAPAIIAVPTTLESDWKKLLLANSITLTPGTLTIDIKESTLYIHVIEYHEGEDKRLLIKAFEDAIAKI